MRLRFLKTTKSYTVTEPCYDVPKWLRFLPMFRPRKTTYMSYSNNLQVLENGKWIDVPTIEVKE